MKTQSSQAMHGPPFMDLSSIVKRERAYKNKHTVSETEKKKRKEEGKGSNKFLDAVSTSYELCILHVKENIKMIYLTITNRYAEALY